MAGNGTETKLTPHSYMNLQVVGTLVGACIAFVAGIGTVHVRLSVLEHEVQYTRELVDHFLQRQEALLASTFPRVTPALLGMDE